jgi:dipeptidyl aminopeptidase/acylaminoacyl peptidase
MLAVSADDSSLEDPSLGNAAYSSRVQAAVVWYGPTNFLKMDDQLAASGLSGPVEFSHNHPNSPESLLLGEQITRIPDRVKSANPETHIGRNIPPILLQHGRKDPVVPVQQSIEFYQKLKKQCNDDRVILEVFENAEHADPAFETPENIDRVFRFLKANKIY